MYSIRFYINASGRDIFKDWHRRLRDAKATIAIDRRLRRIEAGNFGDHKYCMEGVWELRVDVGAGYRVYYAVVDQRIILLLCGGDKSSQGSDIERAILYIERAILYWRDWKERVDERS